MRVCGPMGFRFWVSKVAFWFVVAVCILYRGITGVMILVCRIWGLSGLRFRNLFVWLSLASSRATMLEPRVPLGRCILEPNCLLLGIWVCGSVA